MARCEGLGLRLVKSDFFLDALQKQVMPHFIFNVIPSIHRLISLENYQTVKEMTSSFAKSAREAPGKGKTA